MTPTRALRGCGRSWLSARSRGDVLARLRVPARGLADLRRVRAALACCPLPAAVEVLPGLPLPDRRAWRSTIGFLYIGGLPIIVLHGAVARALLIRLRLERIAVLPALALACSAHRWWARARSAADDAAIAGTRAADWATFSLGLGVRWWRSHRCSSPSARRPPTRARSRSPSSVGYVVWGVLSVAARSISFQLADRGWHGATHRCTGSSATWRSIIVLALTPFVFLIAYGYQRHGLAGAGGVVARGARACTSCCSA